jgi:hypothetical protein
VNNSIPETQAIAGIRLTSPYARTAVVQPYGFDMRVSFEYDPGEAMVFWPTELAHPGSPPTVSLLSCRIGETEVYDMLSNGQIETIEEEILSQLEE